MCMLYQKELPNKFWAEAANTTVFIQNRIPARAIQNQTPFEAWFGFKPSLDFFLKFLVSGATHMYLRLSVISLTLEPNLEYLLDITQSQKLIRLFSLKLENLVSRDVGFMQDESWCWSDSKKNQNVVLELEDTIDDQPI